MSPSLATILGLMRRLVPFVTCLTLIATAAAYPEEAAAYDETFSHRWLTRQAVELLVARDPGRFAELSRFVEEVVDGSEHEDDLILDGDDDPRTMRVMRHFFRPTDGAGLTFGDRLFVNSYEWGVLPNLQNRWGWEDALERYREGDLAGAYFALGHVIHLVQDLTVPAHSHLDVHGPPFGDDYESYVTSRMLSDRTSLFTLELSATPVPRFSSLEELWRRTGEASFWRNMYPGDLSDTSAPSGVIAEMFPDINFSWLLQTWEIPGVGRLGQAFHEHSPGFYYFEKLGGVPELDRVAFDPAAPRQQQFAENDGATMAERLAPDLVPVAVLHSAALMEMFADEVAGIDRPPADGEREREGGGCAVAGSSGGHGTLLLLLVASSLLRRSE